jgi:hypothetical protein
VSSPKHTPWTPGPWGYGVPVKGGRAVVEDANGNVVCVVEGGPLRREVTIANAQLIAAAPRLAEELSDLAKHLEEHDPQGDVQAWLRSLLDYHLPQARAALREAGVTDDA